MITLVLYLEYMLKAANLRCPKIARPNAAIQTGLECWIFRWLAMILDAEWDRCDDELIVEANMKHL